MKNIWLTYSKAAKQVPAKLLNRVKREFGTKVALRLLTLKADMQKNTGNLTFLSVMVRVKRKGLSDLIAVWAKGWRYFTDEVRAAHAFNLATV